MIRSRRALALLGLAAIGVAGCGGAKDATEGSVRDDVRDQLLETGYLATPDAEVVEITDETVAEDIGICVSRAMFENTDQFSREERNAATSVADGDQPDPDLVIKVHDLVDGCFEQVVNGAGAGDESPTSDGGSSSDDETTTTAEG